MTKNQAILAQFSTAIAAYCGTFVGLFGMQSMKDLIGSDIMVPFTAGEFVTIIEPCDDMESYVGIEGEETGAVSAGFGIFGGD